MLADTTFLIDFLRGEERARNRMEKLDFHCIFTTEINVFELATGAHLTKENASLHLQKLSILFTKMTVLSLDRKSSLKAGEIAGKLLKEGKTIPETDCLIAGIALANGIKEIITADSAHFSRIPEVKVISY